MLITCPLECFPMVWSYSPVEPPWEVGVVPGVASPMWWPQHCSPQAASMIWAEAPAPFVPACFPSLVF